MSMGITSPLSGTQLHQGVSFNVIVGQQLQDPPILQGAASLQFSDHEDGPWTTCRPPGGGGPIEVAPSQWTAQVEDFTLEGAVAHDGCYVRPGAWPDQSLTGPPTIAGAVSHYTVLKKAAEPPGGLTEKG